MLKTVKFAMTVRGGQWISVHAVEVSGKTCRSQWMKKAARDWVEVGAWSSWMTWVWGLGPELLQVKRRLPAGRWGPVFRLTDPGKRVQVGLSAV